SNLRDFFTRGDKEKIPAELKHALSLLQLSGLEDLEERFLATDAFLKPWAVFRDSIFLLQPDAMPRATSIAANGAENGISHSALLWFYTQFDEGSRRYDPRANKYSVEYIPDSSVYGIIDKSGWGVTAYEKHLFVWLLQVLKVGKTRNPWGFDFFELRNICSAWEAVLVPIVNVVRNSYNVKGRRHYGRLALFIEERCPSGLAFPEGNITIPEGSLMSPTPYRMVSVPKTTIDSVGATECHERIRSVGLLTRKHYDEAEKELRDVYPQYGGLVERPKFKHKMEEWLADQRVRADRRKAAERQAEVQTSQPQVATREGSRSLVKKGSPAKYTKQRSSKDGSVSPIKRYSDSIRRSLSRGMSKLGPKEEPKSPLHGVTRQIYIPDDAPPSRPPRSRNSSPAKHESFTSIDSSDTTIITPWPRPETHRKPSEMSVYSSIRNSNPFTEDLPDELKAQRARAVTGSSVFSPMGQLSAIPRPLHRETERPSYEGSDWQDEISLNKLHTVRNNSVRKSEPTQPAKPPTRLPGPILPAPYAGHLRVASKDSYRKAPPAWLGATPENPLAWPSTSPPIKNAWSGIQDDADLSPPIPPKSPERWNSNRGHVSSPRPQQLVRDDSRRITRIVSKDNIRSALSISRDSSTEDLGLTPPVPIFDGPSRTVSPGSTKLQTFNTNLFPRREERKGTPVGGWV
ncbi:hypothetical protein EJ02DRAFT_323850, partial [Clathrospora elynae]